MAYGAALMVNQIGSALTGNLNVPGLFGAMLVLGGMMYMLVRPDQEKMKRTRTIAN